jgi:L-seryl-tRNA(Ser) seleniumtransferase
MDKYDKLGIKKLINAEGTLTSLGGSVKIRQLPDLQGLKNEVLIQKSHRNGYDHAVRQAGVTLVEFGLIKETYPWELRAAISDRTAAIVHFLEFENDRNLTLSEVISIAKEMGVPLIVDAAAELPPVENLSRFFYMGADLTVSQCCINNMTKDS